MGRTRPREVKEKAEDVEARQERNYIARFEGVQPNTLWRLEAQYLDARGGVLLSRRVDVVLAPGEWSSELAPLDVTPGWTGFRYPGQFGDGPPDLASAMRVSPEWMEMRMSQQITPFNETEAITAPMGAKRLQARLMEVCLLEVRRMEQFNYRPTGDVIAIRRVKEQMRWKEYRVKGGCRIFGTR